MTRTPHLSFIVLAVAVAGFGVLPATSAQELLHGVPAPRYWDTGGEDREFKWNNYLSRYHWRHVDLMDVLDSTSRTEFDLDQVLDVHDALEKLFPQTLRPSRSAQHISLRAARNETEDAQVALRPPKGVSLDGVSFTFTDLIAADGA